MSATQMVYQPNICQPVCHSADGCSLDLHETDSASDSMLRLHPYAALSVDIDFVIVFLFIHVKTYHVVHLHNQDPCISRLHCTAQMFYCYQPTSWRQSIGPKPDSKPRLEGARYKYLTSCSCLLTHPHPSVTHTFTHIINQTPPLLG